MRFFKMKINQLHHEIEGLTAELTVTRRLVETIKGQSIVAERKIQELEVREQIALLDKKDMKTKYDRRIQVISKDYINFIQKQGDEFNQYKEFVLYEIDVHENNRELLEKIVKQKQREVSGLEETLSIPRSHFKNIDKLTNEQIIVQKEVLLTKMSKEMGIPTEVLVEKMYEK